MELTYRQEGDYLIPNLALRPEPQATLGKYAYLRRKYLEQNRRLLYLNLMTSGKLNAHLSEIERTASERMEAVTAAMAKTEGLTEQMKAADPMRWAGLMNSIRSAAEETVLGELIYA